MTDFKNIWIPLSDRFYRVAYYMLESEADAEDAVQELYVRLWTGREKLDDVRNPLAYGIMVLRNICIDRIRKRSVLRLEPLSVDRQPEESPPDRRMAMRDILHQLLTEMDKLPDGQRNMLRMKALENLEYDEISRRTGLSQVNIRVLVSKARKTLKEKIRYEVD